MICGEKIHAGQWTDFFSRSGLYHLVVVSKAHLEFLSNVLLILLSRLRPTNDGERSSRTLNFVVAALLAFYVLMCGPQAPLVRTGFFLLLLLGARRFHWGWSPLFALMLATCASLAFNFEWYGSLSLLHSSGCALAFLLAQQMTSSKWKQGVLAFVFTLPFLWGWANVHPLMMLINWTLAPILFFLWFLLSLMNFIAPPLHFISDFVILKSISWTTPLLEPIPNLDSETHIAPHWLWILFWSSALCGWLSLRYRATHMKSTKN